MNDQPHGKADGGDAPEGPADPAQQADLDRLAQQVEAMKAREQGARAPQPVGEFAGQFAERLAQMMRARGIDPDAALRAPTEDEARDDRPDVRAHQAEVRARAWNNDLRAAEHSGLAHWRVGDLAADQHPAVLGRYADELISGGRPAKLNLILTGRVGPGKTSAAIAVGNAVAEAGLTVRFVKHSTYLAWLRPDGAPDGLTVAQIRARYRTCSLLIFDDLGADLHMVEASEFVQRETNELVGDRLTGERATIYTTNHASDELAVILGPRAISRIGARALALKFNGPDRRKPVTWR